MNDVLTLTLAAAREALAGVIVDKQAIPLVEPTPDQVDFPFITIGEGGVQPVVKSIDSIVAFTVRAVTRGATMRQSMTVLDATLAALKGLSVDGYNMDQFTVVGPDVRVSRDSHSRSLEARVSMRVKPKRKR